MSFDRQWQAAMDRDRDPPEAREEVRPVAPVSAPESSLMVAEPAPEHWWHALLRQRGWR